MPPYDRPSWVVPLWWVTDPDQHAISGCRLIERWCAEMTPPKPLKKALEPELAGWSGRLGATPWVQRQYGPRPAELARGSGFRRIPLDEPVDWYQVSLLYADYADPLARFSAQFAAAVAPLCPEGLPNDGWVRPLKNRVPPSVRAVMAGPVVGPVGGVIDSAEAADQFRADPAAQYEHYINLARRSYLSVLLDRLDKLRDADSPDELVMQVLTDTIARHAADYGDPEQPLRKPTDDERKRVHEMLVAKIEEQPEIQHNPYFTEAYERATRTLLRWVVEGRETIDAGIIRNALKWSRLDAQRKEGRMAAHAEVLTDLRAAAPDIDHGIDVRTQLARAHAALLAYVEDGVSVSTESWEKSLASRLLTDGNSLALVAFPTLADLVTTAWHEAVPAGGRAPVGAAERDATAAACYVHALLCTAVLLVSPTGGAATKRLARIRRDIERNLDAHRRDNAERQ
ncbi:hypothetical protein ACQPW1_24645 [Nocardia sp. CA-128927]|uniref:hypothetical protein n=1 Tax=Nocardia sp. CA-128927 TaxID=3239975 RepID=UPI003D996AC2